MNSDTEKVERCVEQMVMTERMRRAFEFLGDPNIKAPIPHNSPVNRSLPMPARSPAVEPTDPRGSGPRARPHG